MTKFLYWNDVHTEAGPFRIPSPDHERAPRDVDAILIAGDLTRAGQIDLVCEAVWRDWQVPIICVEGNHDLWGRKPDFPVEAIRAQNDEMMAEVRASGADVTLLRRGEARMIGEARVIGATLWTDLQLDPTSLPRLVRNAVHRGLNDYNYMWTKDGRKTRLLVPEDLVAEHHEDVAGIRAAAAEPFDGPTVIMTHHVPLKACMDPIYQNDLASAGFGSDLKGLVREVAADAWIFGHTHSGIDIDFRISDEKTTMFRTNPRGYPHERIAFDPYRTIELS